MSNSTTEINNGERFAFGKNWSHFLEVLDEDRIREAEISLKAMLGINNLNGLTFLDAGCGSGLFSLAAQRMGATVHSFDYDPKSVATTIEMRRRYCKTPDMWHVESGSVLDRDYLNRLGQFDIVYSWGVLHHTGSMRQAMDNIPPLVADDGRLFIALYNDQGVVSRFWHKVKQLYCSNRVGRTMVILTFFPVFALAGLLSDLAQIKNPIKRYTEYRNQRGMSLIHDWVDWLGGYPFETAKPGDVFDFYFKRGFTMTKLATRQSLGCNQYVFRKNTNQ